MEKYVTPKPKVSVFMPVYNTEAYLQESIMSILNQSFKDFELIIIDDGSSDNSINIIKGFNDPRIKLFENGINKGLPYTRNLGLSLANGEYFAVMDSDDISREDRLERQVNMLDNYQEYSVVVSNFNKINNLGEIGKNRVLNFSPHELKINILFRNNILNSSAMIRRSFLKKYQIEYHKEFFACQDYMYWNECSKKGNIYWEKEFLLSYRSGHLNTTKVSRTERAKERKRLIDYIHNDALTYYGFVLTDSDKHLFNDLFGEDNNLAGHNYNESIQLLKKLIKQNTENSVFEEKSFKKIVQYNFLRTLIDSKNLSIYQKYKIFFNRKTWVTLEMPLFSYFSPRLARLILK